LRFKLTLGLLLPLVVALSFFSIMHYHNQRRVLMENLKLSATTAGEIIEGSLEHAIQVGDLTHMQNVMDGVIGQRGLLDLFVVDEAGRVVLSAGSEGQEIEQVVIPLGDATCQVCHQHEATSRNESAIQTNQSGTRVYRNVNTLEGWEDCAACLAAGEGTSAVLITDFSVAQTDRQLAAVARNSLLWSAGSIAAILLIVNLIMNGMVINRLERVVKAITRLREGDLDERVATEYSDEIGELADSFNLMADGLKEKHELEQRLVERSAELQAQAEKLSALNILTATINQAFSLDEILYSTLDRVLDLLKARAGWIALRNGQQEGCELVAHRGLSEEEASALFRSLSKRCVCQTALHKVELDGVHGVLTCTSEGNEAQLAEHIMASVCVPLESKDNVLGILGLIGNGSASAQPLLPDMSEMLTTVGQQIGVAIENARLYDELRQKDEVRTQLLERVISVQEEERKRIARELHDETSQALTSLLVRLQVLEQAKSVPEAQAHLGDLRSEVARALDGVHDLALELRPSVLDDLGLVAALRRYFRDYEAKFAQRVDFQVLGLARERLPSDVEIAVYRIVQEALLNVARHARAQDVSVLLERRGSILAIVIEDDGQGFDAAEIMGSGRQKENLGLYGMQERASLLGGTVSIESSLGVGTAIIVQIPLERKDGP